MNIREPARGVFKKTFELGIYRYVCRRSSERPHVRVDHSMLQHYPLHFLRKGRSAEELVYTIKNRKDLMLSVFSGNISMSFFLLPALDEPQNNAMELIDGHSRFLPIEKNQEHLNYLFFLTPKTKTVFTEKAEIAQQETKITDLFFY